MTEMWTGEIDDTASRGRNSGAQEVKLGEETLGRAVRPQSGFVLALREK